jgi:hypothetical protein
MISDIKSEISLGVSNLPELFARFARESADEILASVAKEVIGDVRAINLQLEKWLFEPY